MVFDRRFEFGLVWRSLIVLGAFALLLSALQTPGLVAARVVALLLACWTLVGLWHHIRRTNFEVARFVDSIRFEDYSQRFATPSGGGFDVLGTAFDDALRQMQARRATLFDETRFLSAVVDDAPVALVSIGDEGGVAMLNKAARRQFSRHPITHRGDFDLYGAELAATVALPPGRRLTRIVLDDVPQYIMVATARVERLGGGLTIASFQLAQHELGAVELAAQTDLVRVLTHEIMNSLTPVTSLARSAAELVAEAAERDPSLADARAAVETLTGRAEGIVRFVDSYRAFARAPEIDRRGFPARPWSEEIARLAASDPKSDGAPLIVSVEPDDLMIDGDADLLAQVVLNLIRNAAIATAGQAERVIIFKVVTTPDRRTLIEIADNGPGIAIERREDVFLPFYTTRAGGSGVGLNFARQIALAHGGLIAAGQSPLGGAALRIIL